MGTLAAFAADLANRPEPALRKLLLLRPDALNPPVPTFVALAARLSTASCISRALDALNAPALQHLGTGPWNAQTSPNSSLMPELYARGLLLLQTDNQTDDAGTGHYMHAPYVLPLALVPNPQMPSSTLPPEPVVRAVTEAVCKNAAGSAADALLRSVDTLADLAAHTPLQALRSGQFAARTVRLVAQNLETDELHTHFLLDLCATAGLLTFQTSTRDWRWAAPWWSELERQEQWVGLIRSWLSSPATADEPALTSRARLLSVVADRPAWAPVAVTSSATTYATTSVSPSGIASAGALSLNSVVESYLWNHPRTATAEVAALPELLTHLEWLGLTGAGACSCAGDAAARNDWLQAASAVAQLLPAAIDRFVIQGDLTAIAPGPLLPHIAAQLRRVSVVEGRGPAGIFRFSELSLTAAMGAGMSAETILNFLKRYSSTTVPPSLEFLIAEAARAQRTLTPTPTQCLFAPQQPAPPHWVGDAPWPGSGVVLLEEVEAQLALLRAAGKNTAGKNEAGQGEVGPALVLEGVRRAVACGLKIRVHAVNNVGVTEHVTAVPVSFSGGLLLTRLADTGAPRRFSIHRIQSVDVLEGEELRG
ncbi:helicase-associated domain-containing protein [Arthrobacter psychrochitiniphilus]|uniref:helicase-associated domain-containing protein n=1 Tax=Arthrobacter psychrochitiniphilus TaxID=291045 RepID=UPI003F7C62D7